MAGEVEFRKATDTSKETPANGSVKTSPLKTVSTSTVEVPYLDYEKEHSQPYAVEYFGIGDKWNDPVGGFPKEVETIESYFEDKISSGDMANSISAVKDRLKEILKITNMSKEERNVIRVETIAAYIKFLKESDGIKHSVKRYGANTK